MTFLHELLFEAVDLLHGESRASARGYRGGRIAAHHRSRLGKIPRHH
jgi:hypothetical protein